MKTPSAPQYPPLAYEDPQFLGSEEGRPLRILAEYLQPLHAFRRHRVHDTIVFFGSARAGEDGPLGHFYRDARELARLVTVSRRRESSIARFPSSTARNIGVSCSTSTRSSAPE